jgi:hypothetical protein
MCPVNVRIPLLGLYAYFGDGTLYTWQYNNGAIREYDSANGKLLKSTIKPDISGYNIDGTSGIINDLMYMGGTSGSTQYTLIVNRDTLTVVSALAAMKLTISSSSSYPNTGYLSSNGMLIIRYDRGSSYTQVRAIVDSNNSSTITGPSGRSNYTEHTIKCGSSHFRQHSSSNGSPSGSSMIIDGDRTTQTHSIPVTSVGRFQDGTFLVLEQTSTNLANLMRLRNFSDPSSSAIWIHPISDYTGYQTNSTHYNTYIMMFDNIACCRFDTSNGEYFRYVDINGNGSTADISYVQDNQYKDNFEEALWDTDKCYYYNTLTNLIKVNAKNNAVIWSTTLTTGEVLIKQPNLVGG